MAEISSSALLNILLFLTFPLFTAYIAVKLKASPFVGYIFGGILLGLTLRGRLSQEIVSQFSLLGLILLIFTIGLETNFSQIRQFGKFVLIGGTFQIVLSFLAVFIFSVFFGFSLLTAIFFGMAFVLSSTAVVAKIIQDKGEENSLLGGLTIGILLFQDLALIPILIISSSFGVNMSFFVIIEKILFNSIKAVFVLTIVYYIGNLVVPKIFNWLAGVSREILNLFTIVFIVGSLFLFTKLGISSLLAAFLAGVLLGQTLEHYHIFSQIRPYRDLFVVIFFSFLGMSILPSFVMSNLSKILLFSFGVVFIKVLVVLGIFLFFRFHSRTSFSLSMYLFQIGGGAFIVLHQGMINGVIGRNDYLFGLTTVLLTLIFTPFVINNKLRFYFAIRKSIKKYIPSLDRFLKYRVDREPPNIDVLPLKDHIVVCGYGRVGKYIGRALMMTNIPFIAVDYNYYVVEKARKQGVNIIYGDPTNLDVLDYMEVDKASALISAVPQRFSQEMIILNAKRLNSKILIFTRVNQEGDQKRMKDLGVDIVVHPEFEASLSIIRKILLWKKLPLQKIKNKIKRLKIEHGM